MESGEAPAAGGGIKSFACIFQTGSALLPVRLQGVLALLLCLHQLVSHLFCQLGCTLVGEIGEKLQYFENRLNSCITEL